MSNSKYKIEYSEIIIASIGEIALKGLNRNKFESRLIANIKRKLKTCGNFKISQSQSRICIEPEDNQTDIQVALEKVVKVFGVVSASIAWQAEKSIDMLYNLSQAYVFEYLENNKADTFKIEARRADKRFILNSPEICTEVGAHILEKFPKLKVSVKNPDLILRVEVRDQIIVFSEKKQGFRGLPVGSAGKGLLLLSGGIDSPVAGFMMASRGLEIEAVYFHSYPYTSDQAKEKVIELARRLKEYTGRIRLHIVDFTKIQLELRDKCPEDMLTIHMRRVMMMIAQEIAYKSGAKALITGESLGQVASQTLEALHCTNSAVTIPVFRPLIGLDKEDTVSLARKIGTFDTSVLPFEDCCTLFVAKHPKTKPSLEYTLKCENDIGVEEMVKDGISKIEIIEI